MRQIHRLVLWGSILLLVLMLISGLAYLGFQGHLGTGVEVKLREFAQPLVPFLPPIAWVQKVAAIVGAVGTALGSTWGILKSLRYAEAALPDRLEEALRRVNQVLVADANIFSVAAGDALARANLRTDAFADRDYAAAIREFKTGRLTAAQKGFRAVEEKLLNDEEVVQEKLNVLRQQRVSALLARAAIEIDSFSKVPETLRDESAARLSSLNNELKKVVEPKQSELVALQLRGDILRDLNLVEEAKITYEKLISKAGFLEVPLLVARGHLRLAQLDWSQDTQVGRREACTNFTKAEAALGTRSMLNDEHRRELVEICLAHATVRSERNQWPSVEVYSERAWNNARRIEKFDVKDMEASALELCNKARAKKGKLPISLKPRRWWRRS